MINIGPALPMPQGKRTFYTIVLTVDQLLQYGRIERFGEDANGVQRKLNQKHADDMLKNLIDQPDVFFKQSMDADLQGDWTFDKATGLFCGGPEAYITIDDGSHRFEMCHTLAEDDPELASQWSFTLVCGVNSAYEERLTRFLQQEEGRAIDRRLTLAQRARLGRLGVVEQEAYSICMMLNDNPRSPLRGLIITDEQVKRPYSERTDRNRGVNITGLMASLNSVLSRRSPLRLLNRESRATFILTYIQMVKETWPTAWNSDTHMLVTSTGIQVVLELISKSPAFMSLLGENFSQANVLRALRMAKSFNWTTNNHKGASKKQLLEKLENSLLRNRLKHAEADQEADQAAAS